MREEKEPNLIRLRKEKKKKKNLPHLNPKKQRKQEGGKRKEKQSIRKEGGKGAATLIYLRKGKGERRFLCLYERRREN